MGFVKKRINTNKEIAQGVISFIIILSRNRNNVFKEKREEKDENDLL